MTQNSINNKASDLTVDNLFLDGNTISSTDTNGNIVLAPDGSGIVSVTASPIVPSTDRVNSLGSATNSWDNVYADGLTFDGGTNVMAEYIGPTSFTPDVQFGGATTGIVATQSGSYMKIGRLVFIRIGIGFTDKGTATGNLTIENLPYSSPSVVMLSSRWTNITLAANQTYIGFFASGTHISTRQCGNNTSDGTQVTNASCSNSTIINISGTYIAST